VFTCQSCACGNVDSRECSCLISACTTGGSSTRDDYTREAESAFGESAFGSGRIGKGGRRSIVSVNHSAGSDTSGRDAIEGNGAHAYEDVGADAGAAADDDAHEDDDADVGAWPESDGTLGTSAPLSVGRHGSNELFVPALGLFRLEHRAFEIGNIHRMGSHRAPRIEQVIRVRARLARYGVRANPIRSVMPQVIPQPDDVAHLKLLNRP